MNKYIFLLPLYNDWESFLILIDRINSQMKSINKTVEILVINDYSLPDIVMCPLSGYNMHLIFHVLGVGLLMLFAMFGVGVTTAASNIYVLHPSEFFRPKNFFGEYFFIFKIRPEK